MSGKQIRERLAKWRSSHPRDRRPKGIYLGRKEYAALQAHAKETAEFLIPDAKLVTEASRVEFGGTPVFEVNAESHINVA